MKVLIDTSPLSNANAIRGVGVYTRLLTKYLEQLDSLQVGAAGAEDQKQKFEPDIVHYPFFDLYFATLPVVRSKPTVVTVHDVIPLRYPKFYPPGVKGKIKLQKQILALKTCEAVITDSQSSKQDIIEFLGIAAEKIHPIYLAANPELEAQGTTTTQRIRNKYQLPKHYLLYVGDINYNKNIPQLIKSLKYVPETLELVLLGKNFKQQDIPEWKWIETQIAMSDVADRVHFLNQVTGDANQELAAIYSGAEIYIQPSLYEGFGLPVLEAMQCKTLVIAAENSSLLEVGGDHVIYTGTDAEQIGQTIGQVMQWPQAKKANKINQAYEWSQTFSWEQTAEETLRVYQSVLAE